MPARLNTAKKSNVPKVKIMLTNKVKFDPQIRKLIKKCCEAVIIAENFGESVEISVILTNNNEIHELNKEYRNKDTETDVLSFPMNEKNPDTGYTVLGDIVISVEKALKQAEEYGHGADREIAFLTVHSMLHLLGYDHENDEESEKLMRGKQSEILNNIGFSRGFE